VASGISGTVSPHPQTRGSYSFALTRTPSTIKTPKDPEIQALQDQVTKLKAIIEDLKAQTVPPTPPPAPDPTAPSAQYLAKQVEHVTSAVTSLQNQFCQFLEIHSSNGEATKSPARKKHCSTTSDSEECLSKVESQESDGATMDHES
jgi:hypothetical protein